MTGKISQFELDRLKDRILSNERMRTERWSFVDGQWRPYKLSAIKEPNPDYIECFASPQLDGGEKVSEG